MRLVLNLIFLILLFNRSYGQTVCAEANLEEDLIAHFPLNNNAVEKLGSGFNGTVNGALPSIDKYGTPSSAYLFNGIDDYIHIGDHFDLDESSFTISCLVNVFKFKGTIPGTSSTGGWIVNKGVTIFGTPRRAGYALDARKINGKNYFYFFIGNQNDEVYYTNKDGFEENVWYSLIGIKNNDSISLYVDNVLVGTTLIPKGTNVQTNIPLVFGSIDKLGNDAVGTTYFDGIIDDVRIYKKVLSSEERSCLLSPCIPPMVNLGEDRTICNLNSIQLDATVPEGNYRWQDGSSNPILEINESGLYWVTVTNNCTSVTDSIYVEFSVAPFFNLGEDLTTCEDNTVFLKAGFPNAKYRWSDGTSTPNLEVKESGIYWLEIENNCGIIRDSIVVELNKLPEIDLGEDRIVCDQNAVQLDASVSGGRYKWQDGSESSTIEVRQSGTYWVEVENSCGIGRDTVKLIFPDFNNLEIPNVFTPNGDDKNQYFIVDSRLLGSSLRVYQRTGKKVFESNNYQNKWDGSNLPPGVYYWVITNSCGSKYKGWVTILY